MLINRKYAIAVGLGNNLLTGSKCKFFFSALYGQFFLFVFSELNL